MNDTPASPTDDRGSLGAVSLGDLARVAAVLRASGPELAQLASLLGFGRPIPADATAPTPSTAPTAPTTDSTVTSSPEPAPGPRRAPEPLAPTPSVPDEPTPANPGLRLEERPPLPRPRPATAAQSLESLLDASPSRFPLAESSLFSRRHQRAIVTEGMAAWDPVGPPDVDAIVRRLARARSLDHLPRLATRTQRRGAQVLFDVGEGMQPFLQDVRELRAFLHAALGQDGLQFLAFANCPTRGCGPGPLPTWKSYTPPPPGIPVLVVTDLGLSPAGLAGDTARMEEWETFAAQVRGARCPLVVWTPYPAERHPPRLAAAFPIVPWQRGTTVLRMRRAVESAWRRL